MTSQFLSVLHEAPPLRDLIIELLRCLVGFVRHPVEPACAGVTGHGLDRRNQLTPRATAAGRRFDEEIFEVAVANLCPGRAMQQIMREADQPSAALGYESAEGFERIEETPPRRVGDIGGKAGLIEGQIALPQRLHASRSPARTALTAVSSAMSETSIEVEFVELPVFGLD